jgi:two-component system, NarL family, invasion response regulator UvrY
MIKIIVVDDHPLLRAGLIQTINKEVDMKVLAEADSGEEFLSKVCRDDFDVAILDIELPGRNGIETLMELRSQGNKLPVIILSAKSEKRFGVRSIQAGANSYISKEDHKTSLINAIRKVLGGKKFITPKLSEIIAENLDASSSKLPHENLSNREMEVMHHIALGKPVSEIAEILSLSINTINTYRARILEKLRVENNTQVAIYALQNNLLD